MLRSKSFVKVSNKGAVVKVVREHYLRDDLPCGLESCAACPPSTMVTLSPTLPLLVPDTNIILHHIDVLEHPLLANLLVLQTVLEEVKNRSPALHTRIRNLTNLPGKRCFVFSNEHHRGAHIGDRLPSESDNDRNDRAIRTAAQWYAQHSPQQKVILLTNDQDNRAKANASGLAAFSLLEYVQSQSSVDPTLVDMLEKPTAEVEQEEEYDEYLPLAALLEGVKQGKYVQGTFSHSSYHRCSGTVQAKEITVSITGKRNVNRAMHNDIVVVQLIKKSTEEVEKIKEEEVELVPGEETLPGIEKTAEDVPQGRVLGVIRRSGKMLVGTVDRKSVKPGNFAQSLLVVCMDKRYPRIRIRTRQAEALLNQRIVVTVDTWERTSRYPQGHLTRILGMAGDRTTETAAILLEYDVSHEEFVPAVMACLPSADWKPTAEDYATRADYRHLSVCSVDPPGCTDIDDALHAVRLENGNYQVGVHIADVTHFVQMATPIDKEAASRATTVYLVDRRIDMLPGLLGTNLCSLKCNVERLAFSVVWEVNAQCEIQSTHFTKSIIASKASFTYDQAQARLDSENSEDDELTKSLKILNALAKILKQRRIDAGALTLASPEVRFNLDRETMNPVDVELKELKAANSMVEEFMLLANISVAQKLYQCFPETALLRRHPNPPADNFRALNQALEPFGLHLDTDTSKQLADSLDRAVVPSDAFMNKLIRIMTTRCMFQAQYFSTGMQTYEHFWHYGLACPIYTHFTSPIRRYADVLVHRLLSASIGFVPKSTLTWSKEELESLCDNLNYRNRMAQQAQRSSIELYTHLYFRGKGVIEQEAYVIRVLESGLVVFLPQYGIEGLVNLKDEAASLLFNANEMSLQVGEHFRATLFQKVLVDLVIVENETTLQPKFVITLKKDSIGSAPKCSKIDSN